MDVREVPRLLFEEIAQWFEGNIVDEDMDDTGISSIVELDNIGWVSYSDSNGTSELQFWPIDSRIADVRQGVCPEWSILAGSLTHGGWSSSGGLLFTEGLWLIPPVGKKSISLSMLFMATVVKRVHDLLGSGAFELSRWWENERNDFEEWTSEQTQGEH